MLQHTGGLTGGACAHDAEDARFREGNLVHYEPHLEIWIWSIKSVRTALSPSCCAIMEDTVRSWTCLSS